MPEKSAIVWAITRISLGWVFFWAFIDKMFGLGFATESGKAWINGYSPTFGFLNFGSGGPLGDFFKSLASDSATTTGWVDFVFMAGLLGIGVALLSGFMVNLAACSGATMMALMYLAAMPPDNNPFMDDHIIYALVLVGLAWAHAGRTWGLGAWWSKQKPVQKYWWLE